MSLPHSVPTSGSSLHHVLAEVPVMPRSYLIFPTSDLGYYCFSLWLPHCPLNMPGPLLSWRPCPCFSSTCNIICIFCLLSDLCWKVISVCPSMTFYFKLQPNPVSLNPLSSFFVLHSTFLYTDILEILIIPVYCLSFSTRMSILWEQGF